MGDLEKLLRFVRREAGKSDESYDNPNYDIDQEALSLDDAHGIGFDAGWVVACREALKAAGFEDLTRARFKGAING